MEVYFCVMIKVWFGIGSNEGDRMVWLQQVVDYLLKDLKNIWVFLVVEILVYGFDGNDFLNVVIFGEWDGNVYELLIVIFEMELKFGRNCLKIDCYINRSVDIDILLFGNEIVWLEFLEIFYLWMLERVFVLFFFVVFMLDIVYLVVGVIIKEVLEKCVDEIWVLVYKEKLLVSW